MDNSFLAINKHKIYSAIRFMAIKDCIQQLDNLPYAIVKGEPLSFFSYGEYSKRITNDIDILTTRSNVKDICNVFLKHGFQFIHGINRREQISIVVGSHQVVPLYKRINSFDINIDLNFDVFWGEYTGKRIDMAKFLSDTFDMDVYGCIIRSLRPLKSFVQLILHHYKEMNSIYHLAGHNCINYNMFKDVYYLWKKNKKDITLERLYFLCHEYEIVPYAFYVLYFTNWIFKDVELQKYIDALHTSEGEYYLDYYGLAEKERKLWKVDFQTRLETDNLYELIKDDLTEEDIEKLERNRRIFG